MKRNLPSKDLKCSRYKIVVYFFRCCTIGNQKAGLLGQQEPVNGFEYWRNRIYWYIENSEFGIKRAAIYDNKNTDREKEPILTILDNGAESANQQAIVT